MASTQSFFSRDTNNSMKTYAKAAADNSYKYYNNMTWSMWVALTPGVNKDIWSMWEDVATNNRSWLFSTQDDGTLRIIFSASGTAVSSNYKTTTAIFDYSWKHIVITFASGSFFVYVNNVLQTLSATTPWTAGSVALYSAAQQLLVGSKNPAAPPNDETAGGCYSNFSMWNKVLSTAERTELYNSGRPGTITSHSAVASLTNWWRMDQTDTAPTLADSVAAGAAMTISKTGTNSMFNPSDNYPKVEDYPSAGSVLNGVVYNGATQTGTFVAPTAAAISTAVWGDTVSTYTSTGTFGLLVSKVLTVAKFLGLK